MLFKGNDLILKDSSNGIVLAASKSLELNINGETIEVARTSSDMWRNFINYTSITVIVASSLS